MTITIAWRLVGRHAWPIQRFLKVEEPSLAAATTASSTFIFAAATVAGMVHRVRARVRDGDGEHDLAERETIVSRREADGRWLDVHGLLSPEP